MKNKTKISKFFETLIYTILLALPLISVFARVIYTQSNNHAYLSYSDTHSYQSLQITEDTSSFLVAGRTYTYNGVISNNAYSQNQTSGDNRGAFYWTECSRDFETEFTLSFAPSGLYVQSNNSNPNQNSLSFFNDFDSSWTYKKVTYDYLVNLNFTFILSSYVPVTYAVVFYKVSNIQYVYSNLGKLDNAFDYGIQKTIDDFGIGNINFLNWFGNMFSNNTNLLYINFVNMYLNYALWVSVGYLLYYFLNWFLRFVRETLDRLIYKESNQ